MEVRKMQEGRRGKKEEEDRGQIVFLNQNTPRGVSYYI